ncbi:hypothetical protein CI238_11996 [Colletotrichum incanum]|uniref:PiggyBac transposable element-derived protein domain-containing protein n=1 Tax=Colletotrichum incanum TaxID=1573173 RepID=A0A167CQJ8_COLIC|nr:hypothetical protein CI238_11996 [Colletotrichum incanum]
MGTTAVRIYPYVPFAAVTTRTGILINVTMWSSDSDASDASDAFGASVASVKSTIIVEILLEDLAAACTADCTPERCDNSTVRPYEPPALERGPPGSFIPFDVPARAREIRDLPAGPFDLFLRYIPLNLVDQWAQWTNEAPLSKEGPRTRQSRTNNWQETSAEEIYLIIGIVIYMGIHSESQISRHWSTQQRKDDLIHPFTRFISRNRFQLLLQRLRIFDASKFQPGQPTAPSSRRARAQPREDPMPDIYRKVNQWSVHIQETGDSFYILGSELAVDEDMVRFTGRSLETTTIPTKPTPTGFKIWILAQSGYCLRWLWHVHGKGPHGLVPQARPLPGSEAGPGLIPTQRVVTTLVALLPAAIYHVFLDNLFASVRLFRALRKQQIGASGTCRKDSGISEILVAEKEVEGRDIPWGQVHSISIVDGQDGTIIYFLWVNQFTWKDNVLVLFLTTVFRDGQELIRSRRRSTGDSAAKRAARQVFGPEVCKDLPVPEAIDAYSHNMNGVDTGDQMRSYYQWGRPIGRGGSQSIAWNFLLEIVIVNSFLLQLWGKPSWRTVKSQYQWRQLTAAQLIQQFGPSAEPRRRAYNLYAPPTHYLWAPRSGRDLQQSKGN